MKVMPSDPYAIVRSQLIDQGHVNMAAFESVSDVGAYWKWIFRPLLDAEMPGFERHPFRAIIEGEPDEADMRNARMLIKDKNRLWRILIKAEKKQDQDTSKTDIASLPPEPIKCKDPQCSKKFIRKGEELYCPEHKNNSAARKRAHKYNKDWEAIQKAKKQK